MQAVFDVKADYGAVGDDSNDDTSAIQAAIDAAHAAGVGSGVAFPSSGGEIYRTTSALTLNTSAYHTRLFSDGGRATIHADHNGNCLVFTALSTSYGGHTLERVDLLGPNDWYPGDPYTPPSTGAGIRMDESYYCHVKDCQIAGFNYGVHMTTAINNTFSGTTYIRNNEIGVYMDGDATNRNVFQGISIRENHNAGVHIDGSSPFPTHNVFEGCLIESNIKYNDGYPDGGNAPADNVGVLIDGGYHNIFTDCYFENQEYAIWITGSSDDNLFRGCRFNTAAAGLRYDSIMLDGANVVRNKFVDCVSALASTTIANVESNSVTQKPPNQYIRCVGLNFFDADYDAHAAIWHLERNTDNAGRSEKPVDGTYFTSTQGDTLARFHHIVIVDSSGGIKTINLSDNATHAGKEYTVYRDGGSNVTLARIGSDTFDDAATSKVLATDHAWIRVVSGGDGERKIIGTGGTVT